MIPDVLEIKGRKIPIALRTNSPAEMQKIKVGEYAMFCGYVLYKKTATYMEERGKIMVGKFKPKYRNSVI